MPATPSMAFDMQADVLSKVVAARSQWVPLAASLHAFHAEQAWKALGMGSFKEWLGQPEVGFSYRTAKDMLDAWALVDEGATADELACTDPSKIAVVLPAIRAGEVTVVAALADCVVLSRSDLRYAYRKPGAALDAEAEPAWCTCTCGNRHHLLVVAS